MKKEIKVEQNKGGMKKEKVQKGLGERENNQRKKEKRKRWN